MYFIPSKIHYINCDAIQASPLASQSTNSRQLCWKRIVFLLRSKYYICNRIHASNPKLQQWHFSLSKPNSIYGHLYFQLLCLLNIQYLLVFWYFRYFADEIILHYWLTVKCNLWWLVRILFFLSYINSKLFSPITIQEPLLEFKLNIWAASWQNQ